MDKSDQKTTRNPMTEIPKYGFKVKLNHKFPEKWSQALKPRIKQIPQFLPLGWRYMMYYRQIKRKGRVPMMDYINTKTGLQIYGAPIGGIGGGTIGRGFKGEFCRYALQPGMYKYHTVLANQFIVTIRDTDGNIVYNQVLSTHKSTKYLKNWKWEFKGENATYVALYPRAWTEYNIEDPAVKLICRQISPVIPHNYYDSSLPCAVFIWSIENNSSKDLYVSITFTFQSGTGDVRDNRGEKWSERFEIADIDDDIYGVMMHQKIRGMPCTYAISSRSKADINVTRKIAFDPHGNGASVWTDLEEQGSLKEDVTSTSPKTKQAIGAAVCSRIFVKSNEQRELEFSLVWDMPKVNFHCKMREYLRYYTKFFYEPDRSSAPEIARYSLSHYKLWERDIFRWQKVVLDDVNLPDWYKSALFNELYYISDGGTIWLRTDETDNFEPTDPRIEYGRFAYLEGQEYRMYNTYDVHFYAAFALAQLWPNLQACIQYECKDNVHMEDPSTWNTLYDGIRQPRKRKDTVPHDMGDPDEEPFKLINAYNIHDVSDWKDLNPKFVLSCFRDYTLTKNFQQLVDFWPTIRNVVNHCLLWDTDNDGLIENGGFPDQTYDTWVMKGPSAYCGSLWLASLFCASKIAILLGEDDDAKTYQEILEKGKASFQEKLWNGEYYNFDSSKSEHKKCIMSDQLCGHWFLRASGFGHEVFPEDKVKSSLETIFNNNVLKFKNGEQGAVNGYVPSTGIDMVTPQSEEMWTGVTYGLSALMIHEGMIKEGFKTAEGVYRTVYEKIGMGFETPEALYENKFYRAIGYMRPLAIWAIHLAWNSRKRK